MRIEQYATTLSGGNGSDIELHSTITGRTLVSTERYYYDSANRATRIIRQDADNDTYECRWEYDHNNNVTNLIEVVNGQTHTSAYTYDLEQRISQFVNDGVTSGYTYDGFGRLSTQTNGTLNKAYTFYNVQREEVQEDGSTRNVTYATSQIHTLTLDAANYDRTYTYTYDANGNILSVSDGTNTTSYVYDSLNQLVRENNQAAGKTWVYTYDNGGNITSRTAYAYTTVKNPGTSPGPNSVPDTVNYSYTDNHWGDLLTAYKGQTITYDGIGNPLTYGEWEYTWENGRQLAAMESDTAEWTFKYNADGLRTERSNGTVTYDYIYSGSQLIQMTVGTDTLYFTYDASGTPMAVDFNGTKHFYATNLQGDIIAILDNAGNAVVEYTYDAWGNHLSTTGTMANTLGAVNPLRYRGYVFDSETALYYLQSRYYDPELGRFINADAYASTGQGVLGNNMFSYCNNNPIYYVDENGDSAIWWVLRQLFRMGYVHWCVESHIYAKYSTSGVEIELWLTNEDGKLVGRADVMKDGQVWEIKHGGDNPATQSARITQAKGQANSYKGYTAIRNGNTVTCLGPQGAFSGHFTITIFNSSYCVEYSTPVEGVILYVIKEIARVKKADFELFATPYKEPANAKAMVIVNPSTVGIGVAIAVGIGVGGALKKALSADMAPIGKPCYGY